LIFPESEKSMIISELHQTFADLHLRAADIKELVDCLNSALSSKHPTRDSVQIRVDFPESWDSPASFREKMHLRGHDNGKPVSRREALPGIFLNTNGHASVYQILELLRLIWNAPFHFEFSNRTVIIKVADLQLDNCE
jgi:hypothetical protein